MGERFRFDDRRDAGKALAHALRAYAGRRDLTVLALPRGGVPVAYEAAMALHAPLDVFLVRKLGVPGHEELAMGALASGGAYVLDERLMEAIGLTRAEFERVLNRELAELRRREEAYRGARPPPMVRGRTVVVVDDGLATGASMRAAVAALRELEPASIVVAAPVGAADTCMRLRAVADEVVCVKTPEPFEAVGAHYANFAQTTDDEVRALLREAKEQQANWSLA